jgi:hypothetical protein
MQPPLPHPSPPSQKKTLSSTKSVLLARQTALSLLEIWRIEPKQKKNCIDCSHNFVVLFGTFFHYSRVEAVKSGVKQLPEDIMGVLRCRINLAKRLGPLPVSALLWPIITLQWKYFLCLFCVVLFWLILSFYKRKYRISMSSNFSLCINDQETEFGFCLKVIYTQTRFSFIHCPQCTSWLWLFIIIIFNLCRVS